MRFSMHSRFIGLYLLQYLFIYPIFGFQILKTNKSSEDHRETFFQFCEDQNSGPISDLIIYNKIALDFKLNVSNVNDCKASWRVIKSLKKLDLSNQNLVNINFLSLFPSLKKLNLEKNYIDDLSFIKDFPKLKKLNVSDNCISSMGEDFEKKFKHLNLRNNLFTAEFIEQKKETFKFQIKNLAGFNHEEKKSLCSHVQTQIIDQVLHDIAKHDLKIFNIYTLEDIETYDHLQSALSDIGLVNLSKGEVKSQLVKILDFLKLINSRNKYFDNYPHQMSPQDILKDYIFNQKQLLVFRKPTNYAQNLASLNITKDFYIEFYHKLISNPKVLTQASSPHGHISNQEKRSDIILLLASIKKTNNGTPKRRSLSYGIYSEIEEKYTSAGQDYSWFSQLQYKLYKLFEIYDQLSHDQKSLLISYFIHSSRNCSDAKWHAINGAYNALIGARESKTQRPLSPILEMKEHLDESLYRLKAEKLTNYISGFISAQASLNSEYCTYFNTTWDALAPHIRLETVHSRYKKHIVQGAIKHFNPHFYNLFTPNLIYQYSKDDILRVIQKHYLGPLNQLIPDQDRLVIKILAYFYYIRTLN